MTEREQHEPLFESDEDGKVTHVRGVELPGGYFRTLADASLSDRAPTKGSAWIIRGAYKFARRLQGR
jgi:hypothetical protein